MKRSTVATDLTRAEQTALLFALHEALQTRQAAKADHQMMRTLYYNGLWASKVTFDIGMSEAAHAAAMTREWDYSEYPLIKRNGIIINRPSTFPQSLFIEGVQAR